MKDKQFVEAVFGELFYKNFEQYKEALLKPVNKMMMHMRVHEMLCHYLTALKSKMLLVFSSWSLQIAPPSFSEP